VMSASVPRIPGWGNGYASARFGAHGLSPYHGGGLRDREPGLLWSSNLASSMRALAHRGSAGDSHSSPAVHPSPRGGTSPLPTSHSIFSGGAKDQAAGLDWAVRSDGDKSEQGGGYPSAQCHADSAPSISVPPVAGSAGVWGSGRSRSLAPGAALAHTAGSTRPGRPCPRCTTGRSAGARSTYETAWNRNWLSMFVQRQ
jgi:hypothetical protein